MALVGNISGSGGISNTIGITGSLIIANPGLATFPGFPGTDTVFFVSGAIDGKAAGSRTVAVFGGDVVASGSITVGTGSVKLTSNDIQFDGFGTRIEKSGNSLKFFDASNTGGLTLSQLNAGGGGSGTNFFTETSLGVIYNSGTVAFTGARTGEAITAASDKGADVVFYFSGSTAGDSTSLFGGNVVTSGSIVTKTSTGSPSVSLGVNGTVSGSGTFSVGGDILVQGSIKATDGTTAITLATSTGDVTLAGDLAVNGATSADITTTTTTATVFNTTATTVSIAGGATAATNIGNASGLTTIAGDLKVAGNNIKSSTGATAITLSGGNVIIPGDLTVNGTTTTVNTDNLVVKDQLIYIASSSAAGTVTYGGLAIASGSGTTNQALVFVKDGTGATSLWSAGRQDVNSGSATTNEGLTYMPVRASSFEMGGTPGSAVAAGSAYLSSSDALNVLINHTATTTFTKAGTAIAQITDFSGEGMITGNSAVDTIASLWVSGTSVNMAHTLAAAGGPVPNAIKIFGGDVEGGSLRITTSGVTPTLNINAHNGTNQPRALVVSGSAISINAASSTTSDGVLIQGAGSGLARFGGSATNTFINLLGTVDNLIDATTAGSGNRELSLSGSNVNLKHGVAGGAAITLQRGNTKYGEIQYASDGSRTYTQFNSLLNSAVASNVRIGTAVNGANSGIINLSGSLVEVLAGNGAQFQTLGQATTYLTVTSGSYTTPLATALNFAKIEAGSINNLLVGSQGVTVVSGTNGIRMNVGGGNTVAMQSHGTAFLTFASGSGVDNSVTIAPVGATTANLLNTVATTVNFAGAATTLAIATTPTTTQNVNIATGVTSTGNTKTINLGTGGAAGSTTNIVLGSTAGGGTITANENLVPGAANTYDLGAVDNRWRNIYTGDLHLKNDRGNWTIVEEAEFLSITNNLSGKRYKFVLEEI
jgi:hypothetical protein